MGCRRLPTSSRISRSCVSERESRPDSRSARSCVGGGSTVPGEKERPMEVPEEMISDLKRTQILEAAWTRVSHGEDPAVVRLTVPVGLQGAFDSVATDLAAAPIPPS